ncbi:4'-phosphopantetheinyl transferase superfamily protein [Pseudoalteromonas sp. McH1-42]|uniref:4'-phosphopantetheinyl transferase family protein n=1 Tax=Pseudoalteromonas sp. McH1-42 TaxID=2917752 RepID=UPI001EF4D46E|nr:4'-phosphopantetheinyl transferase superfamily protein [Pseudoalteromonas sp. McH1-42]MCG7562694.1 4'-phosphopantetheinyl transferase superfamily protein [Pseudoalteromonas sp. McH1-42]
MSLTPVELFTPQLPFVSHSSAFRVAAYQDSDFARYTQPLPDKLSRAVAKRKAEYLAGRHCASQALKALGRPHTIVASADSRAPIWPEGIQGTITHTQELAMAMVSDDPLVLGLGIDLERKMSDKQEQELQKQILAKEEQTAFEQLSQVQASPLTLIFSAKESIFKALYPVVQRFFGFEAACLNDFSHNQLHLTLTETLHETLPQGTQISVYYQLNDELVLTECCLRAGR